jgi:hypothetical protein
MGTHNHTASDHIHKYLGCSMSCDADIKTANFIKAIGTTTASTNFRPSKVKKYSRIKL